MDLQDWSWEETRATPREKNNTKLRLLGVCRSNNSRCTFIYLPCRRNLGAKSKSRKHFVTTGWEKKHEACCCFFHVWWIKKCNWRPCTCHSPGLQGQLTRWLRDIHSHLEDWYDVMNQGTWGHHLTLWSQCPPGGDVNHMGMTWVTSLQHEGTFYVYYKTLLRCNTCCHTHNIYI